MVNQNHHNTDQYRGKDFHPGKILTRYNLTALRAEQLRLDHRGMVNADLKGCVGSHEDRQLIKILPQFISQP